MVANTRANAGEIFSIDEDYFRWLVHSDYIRTECVKTHAVLCAFLEIVDGGEGRLCNFMKEGTEDEDDEMDEADEEEEEEEKKNKRRKKKSAPIAIKKKRKERS